MPSFHLPRPGQSVLMSIDIQERLAAAMPTEYLEGHIRRVAKLVLAAGKLDIPVLVTEQYPRGLGPTLPVIRDRLPENHPRHEKTSFSCLDASGVREWLADLDRDEIVLTGMEAHVCVLQTALGLLDAGYDVTVVSDAILSRYSEDYHAGIGLLRQAGARVASFETVLFGWIGDADTTAFKELSSMVRERDR